MFGFGKEKIPQGKPQIESLPPYEGGDAEPSRLESLPPLKEDEGFIPLKEAAESMQEAAAKGKNPMEALRPKRRYAPELLLQEKQSKLKKDTAAGILTGEQIVEREIEIARERQKIEDSNKLNK